MSQSFQTKKNWSSNTSRVYAAHWSEFETWCHSRDVEPLPASTTTLGDFIDALTRRRPQFSTLRMRVVAIGQVHEAHGFENPAHTPFISEKVFGARLELPDGDFVKTPADQEIVHRMVRALEHDNSTKLLRDRSILLVGAATGFTRSDLVSLQLRNLHWRLDGLQFSAPRKTRVDFHPQEDVCPVRTLRGWLDAAAVTEGPIFRAMDRWGNLWPRPLCAKTVSRLVKTAAANAGLTAAEFSSSSLC